MPENTVPTDFAADILEGTRAIAAFLGKTERQTQWLLETKQIPAFKLGGRWHGRRSAMRDHILALEAAAKVAV